MIFLVQAVNLVSQIIIYMLIGRAVLSWFVRGRYGTAYKIYMLLTRLTEPVVAPCRKITRRFNTGMFDISVMLAFLLVMVVRDLLIRLLLFIA